MKKTKIICTMGPNMDTGDTLRDVMLAGMDVARLNFSHGSHEEHKGRLDHIKELREELGIPVAILLDTKGYGRSVQESFRRGKKSFSRRDMSLLYVQKKSLEMRPILPSPIRNW